MSKDNDKIAVGISSCLLGDEVRFNGGHKRDRFMTDVLGEFVRWLRVCPEVEFGLGVPRESLRLVQSDAGVRMVGTQSDRDITKGMNEFSAKRVEALKDQGLRGFILKKDSPSCGMERVKVYDHNMVPQKSGRGLFGGALLDGMPNLPVEEEGRINDARIRENFITRIFAYDRWLKLRSSDPGPGDLVRFHTAHKMLLLAHKPEGYRRLGQLVAKAGAMELPALLDEYETMFTATLARIASPGRHVNVLQHFAGFLKDELSADEKQELQTLIADYKRDYVPLVAVLSLLQHHLTRLGHEWVEAQVYLDPYPKSLALRSRI